MQDASPQHFHVGSPNKGGKFPLVPPGYTGEIPQSGYHVVRAPLHNYNVMVRGILTGGLENVQETVQTVKKLKIYPWSERSNPKPNKFISMSNAEIDTLPPQGMDTGGFRRTSTTTLSRNVTSFTWACSRARGGRASVF